VGYNVWVRPQALKEITALPGNVRNRVKLAIDSLAQEPRPQKSAGLRLGPSPGGDVTSREARCLRLDHWRIIYLVNDAESWVVVVAVRRRPPYDYRDLASLTSD
jgi:mRNA-degrading endonuclease RelE of RelBE toxin-antitoxin system